MKKILLSCLLFATNVVGAAYYDEFYLYLKNLCEGYNVEEACQTLYGNNCTQGLIDEMADKIGEICEHLVPFESAIEELNLAKQALPTSRTGLRESRARLLASQTVLQSERAIIESMTKGVEKAAMWDKYRRKQKAHKDLQNQHQALQDRHQALQNQHHVNLLTVNAINQEVYEKRLYICGAGLGPALFCTDGLAFDQDDYSPDR